MAWIKIVEEDPKSGVMREITASGVTKIFSLRPELKRQRDTFSYAMTFGGSGLGRYREELIATSISALVHCKF